jgi:tetratricopeptide (TPR) repeat protein
LQNNWRPAVVAALRETAPLLDDTGARTAMEVANLQPLRLPRVVEFAYSLLIAEQLDAAAHVFHALATALPAELAGPYGLARVALRRRNWPEAVSRLEAILRLRRADVVPQLIHELAAALVHAGRGADAFDLLESEGLTGGMPIALRVSLLYALIRRRRMREARTLFGKTVSCAEAPGDVAMLLDLAAPLFEGCARTETFRRLWQTADLLPAADARGQAAVAALKLRLLLALRDYDGFRRGFDQIADPSALGAHAAGLRTVAARLADPRFPDRTRGKVFGIGLSRTGTTSLAAALAQLGLLTLHWANRLTGEMLSDSDLPLFDAFLDTPACMNFERNYYLYPQSKFIYTTRPWPDWVGSWTAYTQHRWQLSGYDDIADIMQRPDQFEFGTQFADVHLALYYNHGSYEQAFDAYDRRVRIFFADKPADRFLQLDLFGGDGWAKLCAFLGVDPPDGAFPWENRGAAR